MNGACPNGFIRADVATKLNSSIAAREIIPFEIKKGCHFRNSPGVHIASSN